MSEEALPAEVILSHADDTGEMFPELDWRWEDVLAGLMPILAVRISVGLYPEKLQPLAIPLTVIVTTWMWFFPVVIARLRGAQLRLPPLATSAMEAVIAIPTTMMIWIGLGIVLGITLQLFPNINQNTNPFVEPAARNLGNPLFWLFLLTACTAGPLGEELFFRGMIYRWLKQHVDIKSAILLQGLLFGFVHTYGVLHSILASFLGIAFATAYEWRKTLVMPICLHVMQNTVAMIATLAMALILSTGPFLGVWGEGKQHGCQITRVEPNGSAADAGIQVGDIVAEFGSEPITDFDSLKGAIGKYRVGDRVKMRYFRSDKMQQVDVKLKSRNQVVED
ncbi:MAG: htrA 3 [Schlesneria sp.]|nr:htrA 3 [Schlesneria sp.]